MQGAGRDQDRLPAKFSSLLHFPLETGAVSREYPTAAAVPSPGWKGTTAPCGGVSSIGGETGEPAQLQRGWGGPALGVRAVGTPPVPSLAAPGWGLNPGNIPHLCSPGALPASTGGAWPHRDFYGNPGTEQGGIAQTICSSPTYKLDESVFHDDITTNALLLFITQPSVMVSSCAKHASGC